MTFKEPPPGSSKTRPSFAARLIELFLPMVRIFQQQQTPDSQLAYQQWIASKQASQRDSARQAVGGFLPNPFVDMFVGLQEFENSFKGALGEGTVIIHSLLAIPDSWILINDVLIQQGQQFAQIDHVLIGRYGLFLIETKAWKGAFLGQNDQWKRKDHFSENWVNCSSPTAQNLRHAQIMKWWLAPLLPFPAPAPLDLWMMPVVVMVGTSWLKTRNCSMPVLLGSEQLMAYLNACPNAYLEASQVDQLAALIVNPGAAQAPAKPQPVPKPKPEKPQGQAKCRKCNSANLSLQFGYSQYHRCQDCGNNQRLS